MRSAAPGALLLNFTNPAGLITEALARHAPDIAAAGVCNVGITTKMKMIDQLEAITGERIDPRRAVLHTLGLNHLTWHRAFTVDGEDLWSLLFPAYLDKLRLQPEPEWDVHLLESLRMIPNDYLHYYYNTSQKLQEQEGWPPSRMEGLSNNRYHLPASLAIEVFEAARQGDPAAREVISWAGEELGWLAVAVIRQLDLQQEEVEVVLSGGIFKGGAMILDTVRRTVQQHAPRAKLVLLEAPPVIGALVLGMGAAGVDGFAVRSRLAQSAAEIITQRHQG